MLDTLFLTVLNSSITASFVILVVLCVRLLLKRAPKIFAYGLWAVVLFRLLCPFSIESVISLVPINRTPISADIVYSTKPQINTGVNIVDNVVNAMLPTANNGSDSVNPLQIWAFGGCIIWVVGMLAMVIYIIIQYVRLRRKLIGATPLKDNIYLADHASSPFVMGFIKPRIYLPSAMAFNEQGFIIAHEQCHIKRFDHITRILAFIGLTIHWFNPLVWLAFVLSGKDMEMSCDEAVMKKMDTDIRADYAQSLLRFASGKKVIGAAPLTFGEGDTKGRIKNVMKYKKPMLWVSMAAVVLVVCVVVGLLMSPKTETAEFTGVNAIVMEIDQDKQTMTVMGTDENSVIGDNCILTWEGNPFQTVAANGKTKPLSLADFSVGDAVALSLLTVQETYPTTAQATAILLPSQAAQTALLADLWAARTPYVGDNVAVGKIFSGLSFPENLTYYGLVLDTVQQPYGIMVRFLTDSDTRSFYGQPQNQKLLQQNAIIMFALIENADVIHFSFEDDKSQSVESFTREEAEAIMAADDLYAKSAEIEEFSSFIEEISIKLSSGE